jgi:hypothetical protein
MGQDFTRSLLSYEFHLSKLSKIIGDNLSQLYRPRWNGATKEGSIPGQLSFYKVKQLAHDMSRLDTKLRYWWAGLPEKIRLDWSSPVESYLFRSIEGHIGGFGPEFERYILQMQALAIQLAYGNTIILLYRPLINNKHRESISCHNS